MNDFGDNNSGAPAPGIDGRQGSAGEYSNSGAPGFGGPAQQPGGDPGGGVSVAALNARIADDRSDPNSPKFDRDFAAETDRLFQQAYGDGRPAEADAPPPPDADGQGMEFAEVPPDYAFTPDPRLAPHMDALAQHEQLGAIQERAFAAGVPPQQFNALLNGVLLDILDGKL